MRYIQFFDDEFRYLSNFFRAQVTFEGRTYPTNEHAYQAAKTTDSELKEAFTKLQSPSTAKKIGNLLPLRPGWNSVRVDIMRELIELKFSPATTYGTWLAGLNGVLLCEGNTWHDNFWGRCVCAECANYGIAGCNWLGHLLMNRSRELYDAGE